MLFTNDSEIFLKRNTLKEQNSGHFHVNDLLHMYIWLKFEIESIFINPGHSKVIDSHKTIAIYASLYYINIIQHVNLYNVLRCCCTFNCAMKFTNPFT